MRSKVQNKCSMQKVLYSESFSHALLTDDGAHCFVNQSLAVKRSSERFPRVTRVSSATMPCNCSQCICEAWWMQRNQSPRVYRGFNALA